MAPEESRGHEVADYKSGEEDGNEACDEAVAAEGEFRRGDEEPIVGEDYCVYNLHYAQQGPERQERHGGSRVDQEANQLGLECVRHPTAQASNECSSDDDIPAVGAKVIEGAHLEKVHDREPRNVGDAIDKGGRQHPHEERHVICNEGLLP